MKYFYTVICYFVFFVNGKAQFQFQSESKVAAKNSGNTFFDIPLSSPSKNVDVFLNGEKPKQEYYKVRILEVSGTSNSNDLLTNLKSQAQQSGFDGIILLNKNNYVYQDNSVGSAVTYGAVSGLLGNKDSHYEPPIINGQTLTAVAVKYKSNMGYVKNIVKHVTIQLNDSSGTIYHLAFLLNNFLASNNETKAVDYYLRNISLFRFADFFTNHRATKTNEANGYDFSTGKMETDSGNIKYEAFYFNEPESLVKNVIIKMPTTSGPKSIKRYDVAYDYDIDNAIINKRNIRQGRKKDRLFTDVYNYDKTNRCVGFVRRNSTNDEEIFKVKYDFFDENDLPEAEK